MTTKADVVENRCSLKEFDLLESAGNPQLRSLVRPKTGNLFPFEENFSFLGIIKTIDAVEENRFARSIGTDDGKDFSFPYFQVHAPQGFHPAKGHMQVL